MDTHETGNHSDSEQELIDEVKSNVQQRAIADRLQHDIKKGSCSRMTANNARHKLLKTLHTSIDVKIEAEAKRRKLDPTNSRAGADMKAINRDVDQANVDLTQARIHRREPRANIKRGCMFDGTSQGYKATKREKQAILNICGAVMP